MEELRRILKQSLRLNQNELQLSEMRRKQVLMLHLDMRRALLLA